MNIVGVMLSSPGALLVIAPLLVRTKLFGSLNDQIDRKTHLNSIVIILALLAMTCVLISAANFLIPDYVDNVEPNVVADGWLWWHGTALYPRLRDGADLRGLLYGPVTFLYGLAGLAIVPTVTASKVPALLAYVATIGLGLWTCRRAGATARVAVLVSVILVIVLGINDTPTWVRSDSLLILLAAISACVAARPTPRPTLAAILLGLMAGLAAACKVHGGLYIVPAAAILLLDAPIPRRWTRVALPGIVAAIFAMAMPFAGRGVSFAEFLTYLDLAAHHGLSGVTLARNVGLVLGVAGGVVAVARANTWFDRRFAWLGWSTLGAASIVAVIAAKPLAELPHLLPFAPYAALLLAHTLTLRAVAPARPSRPRRTGVVALLFLASFSPLVAFRLAVFTARLPEIPVILSAHHEIAEAERRYGGRTLAVGWGGNSALERRLAYLRVIPVFAGNPMPYDATSMDDLWRAGVNPDISLANVRSCRIAVWLIPGDDAFAIGNGYGGGGTFPSKFRDAFFADYTQVSRGTAFRTWVCSKDLAQDDALRSGAPNAARQASVAAPTANVR